MLKPVWSAIKMGLLRNNTVDLNVCMIRGRGQKRDIFKLVVR